MNRRKTLPVGALFMIMAMLLATLGVAYGLWSKTLKIEGRVETGKVHAIFLKAFTDDDDFVDDPLKDSGDTGQCEDLGGVDDASPHKNKDPNDRRTSCDPAASGRDPKPRYEKDVARCDAEIDPADKNLAHVWKRNVYPSYFCTAWFDIQNDGSIPVKIVSVKINGQPVIPSVPTPFDLDEDRKPDVAIHVSEIHLCQQIEPREIVQMDIDQHVLQDALQGKTLNYTVEVQLNQFNETECGLLFIASDTEEFKGLALPDRLGVAVVEGATVHSVSIVPSNSYVNGLAPSGKGTLFSGNPSTSVHNEITTGGVLLSSVVGPLDATCCNEDLAFDGTYVWRPDWLSGGGKLWRYLPDGTGGVSFALTEGVGATFVGSTLWVSRWSPKEVGTYDPITQTFTKKFDTATNAGGLAYDAAHNILWVGRGGGTVEAWNPVTLTKIAGSEFKPFGDISDTIDGLAFIGN